MKNYFLAFLLLLNTLIIPTNLKAGAKEIVLHSDSKFTIEASEIKGFIKIDMQNDYNEIYHINAEDINYVQEHHGFGERRISISTDELNVTIYIFKKEMNEKDIIDLINKVRKK